MVWIQQATPPPNKVMNFSLKDFSGGMNNRSDQIADNECSILNNLMFADDTILETRYGQKYYNTKNYGGEIIFIDMFKPYRDADILVVATKDKIFFGDKEYPIKGIPSGVSHFGHYYFSDGVSLKVYAKFNQTYEKSKNPITDKEFLDTADPPDEYLGMTVLERAEKAVSKAEKTRYKEDIRKAMVYVADLGTSDKRKPLQDKLDAIVPRDKDTGDLTNVYFKTIGTKLDGYHVYDIVSPKDGHDRLPKEHLQGVTTVNYTAKQVYYEPCDNQFEDHLLGACKVPENVKYIVSHTGRLFTSGHDKDDDNVFITDLQNPLYFAVSLPMQLPPTAEKITGMHVFDSSVVVGRTSDIYVILGSTNRPSIGVDVFNLKRLNTHTGFASNKAIDIAHNYLIFLGNDGNVYAIQSTRGYDRDLSTIILSRTINLNAEPINLTKEDYSSATSYFYNDEWYLSMKDKTLVYSYRHMAWVMYTGLNARCCYGLDGEWIWGRPEGRIAMFDKVNFFDFGEPYQSLMYSKSFDMDDPNSFKQFREFFLVAHTFSLQYSDIYVTFEVDYSDIKDRAVIYNQIARWGFAKFGDRFVDRNINESVPFVIGRRGRNIKFKITNSYVLDGIVDSYADLENYPEKRDNLLVKIKDGRYFLYIHREWVLLEDKALNQRMKIYQINGDYEMRGKR